MISSLGYDVVDADKIARLVVEPGKPAYMKILEKFGDSILVDSHLEVSPLKRPIDRAKLAAIIFADDAKRKLLNSCIHPYIIRQIWWEIFISWFKSRRIVFLDAPLLIETGLHRFMSSVLVVYVPEELQLERLCGRNPENSKEELLKRIKSQLSIEKKCELADVVIDNSGSIDETRSKVKEIITKLRKEWKLFAITRISILLILPAIYIALKNK